MDNAGLGISQDFQHSRAVKPFCGMAKEGTETKLSEKNCLFEKRYQYVRPYKNSSIKQITQHNLKTKRLTHLPRLPTFCSSFHDGKSPPFSHDYHIHSISFMYPDINMAKSRITSFLLANVGIWEVLQHPLLWGSKLFF